jgi:tetratricopeptide (TPR) repeat protein
MQVKYLRPVTFLLAILFLLFSCKFALADQNHDDFDAGRAALAANDCNAAIDYLRPLQTVFPDDPAFLITMAKSYECVKNYYGALRWYKKYDELVPNVAEIRQKIGELTYLHQKEKKLREEKEAARDACVVKYKKRANECYALTEEALNCNWLGCFSEVEKRKPSDCKAITDDDLNNGLKKYCPEN